MFKNAKDALWITHLFMSHTVHLAKTLATLYINVKNITQSKDFLPQHNKFNLKI